MSLTMVGLIGVCLLFVLIFLNMPVGLSLAMVGFIGLGVIRGMEPGLSVLGMEYFRQASKDRKSVV